MAKSEFHPNVSWSKFWSLCTIPNCLIFFEHLLAISSEDIFEKCLAHSGCSKIFVEWMNDPDKIHSLVIYWGTQFTRGCKHVNTLSTIWCGKWQRYEQSAMRAHNKEFSLVIFQIIGRGYGSRWVWRDKQDSDPEGPCYHFICQIEYVTVVEMLFMGRFNPYSTLLWFLQYRYGNQDTERLSNSAKVTQASTCHSWAFNQASLTVKSLTPMLCCFY